MSISPLPTPPDLNDSVPDFNAKAFSFWGAMPAFQAEANALAEEVNANALEAEQSATEAEAARLLAETAQAAAQANANAAGASALATLWVSGTTYATGVRVISTLNGQLYRRRSTGAGTVDPRDDGTNWERAYVEPELVTCESFFFFN